VGQAGAAATEEAHAAFLKSFEEANEKTVRDMDEKRKLEVKYFTDAIDALKQRLEDAEADVKPLMNHEPHTPTPEP
jgi:phage terminase Nu1 subunit (DNA packaging protein)